LPSGPASFGGRLIRTQTQLENFIPEQHTDFIFSAIGEELGFFVGALLVIVIFWLLCTPYPNCGQDNFGYF